MAFTLGQNKMYIWKNSAIMDSMEITNDLKISFKTTTSIPTAGLVAYYPFNGNTNDESGNENHCTAENCTLTTDHFGNVNSAYFFNGSNSLISRAPISSMFSLSQMTLSAWVKTFKYIPDNPRIIAVGSTGTVEQNYSLIWHSCDSPFSPGAVTFYASNLNEVYSNKVLTADSTWHHIAVTYDRFYVTFYTDGVLDTTIAVNGNLVPLTDGILRIGNNYINNDPFNGVIDEVRIYNRALNPAEVWSIAH